MRRIVGDPWFYPVLFMSAGLFFMVTGSLQEKVAVIAAGVVMAAYALTYLPALRVRSRPFADAQAHVDAGGVVVFWRPGCTHCMRLLKTLSAQERGRVYWVNIWQEAEAAAALERLHERREGRPHQAVPTVWARKKDFIVADDMARARLTDMLGSV